ncbi:NAD(P)-binding Rossmann-fold superfamily protein [Forsythia ovata]|uniref:NAD(P)-binding Rossmann-fold superfamily protein n=1 Tax=Forsythia ovata TaxID=205694 RepID=A0ABD1VGH5_9LAMI
MEKNVKVCVTGASGYLGSFLVKELLQRGYTVHATLRNLGEPSKVGLLKDLPHAETRLKLFEADIYDPDEFALAIQACEAVIHLATPLQHNTHNSQYKNTSEAAVAGVKSIVQSCIRSGTVKRLIYTASVVAASTLNDDGSGFKDSMDETCWTPLNLSFLYSNDLLSEYVHSKTLAEKEVLSLNGEGIEVVSLACGLVGGDTLQSLMAESMGALISQITDDSRRYGILRFLEELLGKVPILHIQDAIEAHIFCMENPHINGRFLCASDFLKSADIAHHAQRCYPEIKIRQEFIEDTKRETSWGSKKMEEMGFQYRYDLEKIVDGSLNCARRMGNFF